MWQIYNTQESFVAYKSSDDSKIDLNMNLIFGSISFKNFLFWQQWYCGVEWLEHVLSYVHHSLAASKNGVVV